MRVPNWSCGCVARYRSCSGPAGRAHAPRTSVTANRAGCAGTKSYECGTCSSCGGSTPGPTLAYGAFTTCRGFFEP